MFEGTLLLEPKEDAGMGKVEYKSYYLVTLNWSFFSCNFSLPDTYFQYHIARGDARSIGIGQCISKQRL